MKKLLFMSLCLVSLAGLSSADDTTNAYFKAGPLELNIPMKTASATYMYDFHADQNLVGGETVIASMWNKVQGTVGAVTSLDGAGTPFVGGNILIGNVADKIVTLPPDLTIGGFGGWNFSQEHPIYGLKASYKLW